jgi:hypothetical protein
VQGFVDASIIGWYNYIYGDNARANARIKQDNPEMTDGQLAFSLAKLKEYGIVDSGDSRTLGIGAMTDERMKSFFDKMVAAKVVAPRGRLQEGLFAGIREQKGWADDRARRAEFACSEPLNSCPCQTNRCCVFAHSARVSRVEFRRCPASISMFAAASS